MSTEFSFKVRSEKESVVISTSGYINQASGEQVRDECYTHIDHGIKRVILDLKESRFVNSIGISALIEVIERLNNVGGKLIFANLDSPVAQAFKIMGLFEFAKKADTVEAALALK